MKTIWVEISDLSGHIWSSYSEDEYRDLPENQKKHLVRMVEFKELENYQAETCKSAFEMGVLHGGTITQNQEMRDLLTKISSLIEWGISQPDKLRAWPGLADIRPEIEALNERHKNLYK